MKLVWSRLSAAAIISACALITASLAFAGAEASGGPPNGVWTCGYIAKHPAEAAAAFVSCDQRGPVTVPGVAPVDASLSTLSPCGRVPASGGVSQGVYAWTQNYHYFNYFSYSPAVIQLFTWYVQKQNGSNVSRGRTRRRIHAA